MISVNLVLGLYRENEKISTIYIQWNFADTAKSKFQESILKLVRGIFPSKS
ncbi:hypothetical protein [Leptospira santarosai]|uniref:hypothetical protein n=1 Tax=Leptospira santarosai TaxID=28183 RepID=UPI0024AF9F90|nr:hypothetical protein [Leptospira santarosai]MDI7165435.1 hypothetical protein [Leptospira santarosai]